MPQIAPVAFATHDGDYHVVRKYRWIPDHDLRFIEDFEESYREQIARATSRNGIYRTDSKPQTSPQTIGFRKDALLNEKDGSDYRRGNRNKKRPSSRRVNND